MKKIIVSILVVTYLAGYAGARYSYLLVHYSSYFTNEQGVKVIASHKVSRGDFVGALQPRASYIGFIAETIYMPISFAESMYWYIKEPKNEPWPYASERIDKVSLGENQI